MHWYICSDLKCNDIYVQITYALSYMFRLPMHWYICLDEQCMINLFRLLTLCHICSDYLYTCKSPTLTESVKVPSELNRKCTEFNLLPCNHNFNTTLSFGLNFTQHFNQILFILVTQFWHYHLNTLCSWNQNTMTCSFQHSRGLPFHYHLNTHDRSPEHTWKVTRIIWTHMIGHIIWTHMIGHLSFEHTW